MININKGMTGYVKKRKRKIAFLITCVLSGLILTLTFLGILLSDDHPELERYGRFFSPAIFAAGVLFFIVSLIAAIRERQNDRRMKRSASCEKCGCFFARPDPSEFSLDLECVSSEDIFGKDNNYSTTVYSFVWRIRCQSCGHTSVRSGMYYSNKGEEETKNCVKKYIEDEILSYSE